MKRLQTLSRKAGLLLGIYTTKGTNSPILRRSEEDRVKLSDMKI